MQQSVHHFILRLLLICLITTPFYTFANDSTQPDKKWWGKKVDRSVANQILKAYPDNLSQLKKISENSEYAILAWATYHQNGVELASQLGWKPVKCDACIANQYNIRFNLYGNQNTGEVAIVFNESSALSAFGDIIGNGVEGAKAITTTITDKFPNAVFIGYLNVGGELAEQCSLAKANKVITFNSRPILKNDEPINTKTIRFVSNNKLYKEVSKTAFAIEIKNVTGPLATTKEKETKQDKKLSYAEEIKEMGDSLRNAYENTIELMTRDMLTIDLAYKNGWLN